MIYLLLGREIVDPPFDTIKIKRKHLYLFHFIFHLINSVRLKLFLECIDISKCPIDIEFETLPVITRFALPLIPIRLHKLHFLRQELDFFFEAFDLVDGLGDMRQHKHRLLIYLLAYRVGDEVHVELFRLHLRLQPHHLLLQIKQRHLNIPDPLSI